ncbi:D-aspartate oxidase [Trachymyrmex zeteki]|uniref:D-aspartate oxidase n=1 Tax=Mycetomoellerius zeteki TaxID=64791 RepID=A0A151X9L9_9HYME|nr:D-aspartate oxidase [Trachymyrmex zeteki]
MRVAVVGAGVIGVTSAFAVKSAFPNYDVKIFADAFSPDTTGDGSAGLWTPFLLGDTPVEDITRWAGNTYQWFEQLWKAGLSSKTGVSLLPVTYVTSDYKGDVEPIWVKFVYGFQKLSNERLQRLNEEHKSNYNGLGARELVADETMMPIRGQVYRVKAPWAMHIFLVDDDACNYIIPKYTILIMHICIIFLHSIHSVVIGGTHQEGDFDRSVREKDSKHIYDGCCRIMPSLKGSEIIRAWVGLRPGRPRVRLECESLSSSMGKEFKVIHNYGHGGSGVTLCWGCAMDVVEMIKNLKVPELNSKL